MFDDDLLIAIVPALRAFAQALSQHIGTHRDVSLEQHEQGLLAVWRRQVPLGAADFGYPGASAGLRRWACDATGARVRCSQKLDEIGTDGSSTSAASAAAG